MALAANNISVSFGGKPVISGFSHVFADGGVTVIMGASGCGKTTLLSMLMGIVTPDSGTVNGNDVKLSAVFQEDRLCENLTVSANLRLVMSKRPERAFIEDMLGKVGLEGCADRPVRELSGGMKRRTALLRALIAQYDVLLLDEPFKGLDDETKLSVMGFCKEQTAGKTVVLVTHDKDEADFFGGDIIILDAPQ